MRHKTLYAGAGIASFLLFVIVSIPASIVSGRLAENMHISGVEGTVWNGHVQSLNIQDWQLRNVHWDLNPAALILGRLSATIGFNIAGGEITTTASLGLSGALSLRNLDASGPLAAIVTKLGLPVTGGHYRLRLTALDVRNDWPTRLIGSAQVSGIPLILPRGTDTAKGNYSLLFDTDTVPEDGQLSGQLSDEGGPIEVAGNIILMPPANYEIQAKLKARPNAPVEIAQALNFAGPAEADGRRPFSMSGSL